MTHGAGGPATAHPLPFPRATRHLPDDRPPDVGQARRLRGHTRTRLLCECGAELTPGDRLVASVLREGTP